MSSLMKYACPKCGAGIEFDTSSQKMKCPYCDTEFDLETLQSYDQALNSNGEDNMGWENQDDVSWSEDELGGLRTYVCNSCGGEVVGDENMAATSCPFCGNPVIVMQQFAGDLKPDYVIPFKFDKEYAKTQLRNHVTGKKLVPKIFKDENHIDEIKGIYIPFWIFDTDVNANMTFKGAKIRTYSDSRFHYTETNYYSVPRSGTMHFEHVPVDASSKAADDLMQSLEPFDFSQAVPFQTAYLSGFLADRYDVDAEQCTETANERIRHSVENTMRNSVAEYSSVEIEAGTVDFINGKRFYALYPIWLLNTSWNGGKYTFAMNGQTGKFVGDLPVDKKQYRLSFFLIMFIVFALVLLGTYLFWRLT